MAIAAQSNAKTLQSPAMAARANNNDNCGQHDGGKEAASNTTAVATARPSSEQLQQPLPTKYRDLAIRKLTKLVLITVIPLASFAWYSTKSWFMVLLSIAFMPAVVTIQGCISLITFRILFRTPPSPVTPRHGVVVVHPQGKKSVEEHPNDTTTVDDDPDAKDDCYQIPYQLSTMPKADDQNNESVRLLKEETLKQPPLRLLVVGDSMSVGVGQNTWPTPVMPETIAKTLSRKMGGRAVYWTCHGATGASVGWVIRELERGVQYLNTNNEQSSKSSVANDTASETAFSGKIPASCSSETDESSTDDSSYGLTAGGGKMNGHDSVNGGGDGDQQEQHSFETSSSYSGLVEDDKVLDVSAWRQSLDHHRQRFEPDLSGYYDIVVFTAGPNDVKSAVMPFLLTGEDSELRKQAQARGSSFNQDLQLLLDTLARKMRLRVQLWRKSVEAAAESVLESVGHHSQSSSSFSLDATTSENKKNSNEETDVDHGSEKQLSHDDHRHQHPLVVFPGLPYNLSPAFQTFPICWYGGPPIGLYAPAALEILDSHKHDLASAFSDDILFVPAPNKQECLDYILGKGLYSEDRVTEDTILSVRDLSEEDSREQEERLRKYYKVKGKSVYYYSPFRRIRSFLGIPILETYKGYAADGLHLNEVGYDMWGRYLGHAIYEQWQKREAQHQKLDQSCTISDRKDKKNN